MKKLYSIAFLLAITILSALIVFTIETAYCETNQQNDHIKSNPARIEIDKDTLTKMSASLTDVIQNCGTKEARHITELLLQRNAAISFHVSNLGDYLEYELAIIPADSHGHNNLKWYSGKVHGDFHNIK